MRRTPITTALAALGVLALTLSGCATGASGDAQTGQSQATTALTVFAAASLTGPFGAIGRKFEAEHAGVSVQFSFAGSSDLVSQIQQGAPADLFASADEKNMQKATDAGVIDGAIRTFATNTLTIVAAQNNPKKITSLADLTRSDLQVVVCAAQVPCGSAAAQVAKKAHVTLKPASEESSVKDVLGKVVSGEADAGLVYVTDAMSAGGKVTTIDIPQARSVVNVYPMGVVKESKNQKLAREFEAAALSESGQQTLKDAGFGAPPA